MIKNSLAFLIIASVFLSGCKTRPADDGKPVVTVTILPMRYFAEQLAGNYFRINVMVPPGASHHNYDPTPRQLQELEKSRALFVNGHLGFEKSWILKVRLNYRNLAIIDLSSGLNLIADEDGEGELHGEEEGQVESGGHMHEGIDPHYWMSVTEARKFAGTMAGGLIQADPSCRQMVEDNLRILTARIDSLESSMRLQAEKIRHRSFLIFHPALAYLARDFNLEQHSMELGGKEPTASHFRKLVDLSRTKNINTIFIQKEYDKENAQALAREISARVVVIDPMSPDWFQEMEDLSGKLVEMDVR